MARPRTGTVLDIVHPPGHRPSFAITAEVELTSDSHGVICARGSRDGGYSLFLKDNKLFFVYNFLGIPPEQRLVCLAPPPGTHVVAVDVAKEATDDRDTSMAMAMLSVDAQLMAEVPLRTMTGPQALPGEELRIGSDGSDPVSREYGAPFPFSGGRLIKVVVND